MMAEWECLIAALLDRMAALQQMYQEENTRLAAKVATLECQLSEWSTGARADETGHMFRCAKVNGVWSCAKGCAMARVAALEQERDTYRDEAKRLTDLYELVEGERDAAQAALSKELEDLKRLWSKV